MPKMYPGDPWRGFGSFGVFWGVSGLGKPRFVKKTCPEEFGPGTENGDFGPYSDGSGSLYGLF